MIDVIALTALALLGYLGWRRGTILTALSAGSLLAGYVGAFMLYKPMGRLLEGVFSVPPILAFPLGGMVAMVTVTLLLRLLAGGCALAASDGSAKDGRRHTPIEWAARPSA